MCLTGGDDGNVGVWDLRQVDEVDDWERGSEMVNLSDVAEEDEGVDELGMRTSDVNGDSIKQGTSSSASAVEKDSACVKMLEGHSKAVTALYFEDQCLVSRSYAPHPSLLRTACRSPVLPTRLCANGTSIPANAS